MLDIFNMTTAINESIVNGTVSSNDAEAYEFTGTLEESFAELRTMIMSEAVDSKQFITGANEIMTEAAINNPDCLNTLTENVLVSAKENILKFLRKIKSVLIGIKNKIISIFTSGKSAIKTKTDVVVKQTNEAIKKASRLNLKPDTSGAEGDGVNIHDWNTEYLFSIPEKVDNLVSTTNKFVSEFTRDYMNKDYADEVKMDTDNSKTEKYIIDAFAQVFEFNSISKVSEFGSACLAKMYSTKGESASVTVHVKALNIPKVQEFCKFLSDYNDSFVKGMIKSYDNNIKAITDLEKRVSAQKTAFENDTDTTHKEDNTKLIAASKNIIAALTVYENATNAIQSVSITGVKKIIAEYASVCMKWVSYINHIKE